MIALLVAGVIVSLLVAVAIAQKGISTPLRRLAGTMAELAQGKFDIGVDGADRGDEVGLMARSVEVFKQNGLDARRLAAEAEENRNREAQRQR
ncbi:HAMP domain-containing protein, partial [Acinetobacter baumannii]